MINDRAVGYGLLFIWLLLFAGCATLPGGKMVSGREAEQVRTAFHEMRGRQQLCPAGIDADVTVTFYSLLSSGSIKGYLLAFPPAYLRFEGVNPFGLTENILTTNGSQFDYLLIRRQLAYVGRLDGGKAQKYFTAQQAKSLSYWLLGRLPVNSHIADVVERNSDGDYWLTLMPYEESAGVAQPEEGGKILFSLRRAIVKRYVTESGGAYGHLDVTYRYPENVGQVGTANCLFPDLVTIKLGGHKIMTLAIRDPYPLGHLSKKHFAVRIPTAFERINLP